MISDDEIKVPETYKKKRSHDRVKQNKVRNFVI